jgi:hypothetical protein
MPAPASRTWWHVSYSSTATSSRTPSTIGPSLGYFAERAPIPRFFQVHRGDRHYQRGKITVLPFTRFRLDLDMP